MDYTTLGRTGLRASVAGLGCGGHSRLGRRYGASVRDAVAVVQAAIDNGVTLIDTAPSYGTEDIVGRAIRGRRDGLVLSTKSPFFGNAGTIAPADLVRSLERSLAALGTERIDVYHLHGVMPDQYGHCREHLVPVLLDMREQGKIGFLGLTERFIEDTSHAMLDRALGDDVWDVVMTGFTMINPSARRTVLARTRRSGVGVLDMFAVRRALSRPDALRALIGGMVEDGVIGPGLLDPGDPLGFLAGEGGAESVIDAAYRFCRHEPGIDVVLTGTGKVEHLHENLASIGRGPLSQASLDRLEQVFGDVDSVSGN